MDQQEQGPASGLAPHLTIRGGNAAEAIEFYSRAFGGREIGRHMAEDGKRIMHAHLTVNGASLMLNDDFPEHGGAETAPPAGVTLHLQVDDADTWWDRAIEAGAIVPLPDRRPVLGRPLWPGRRPVRVHLVDRLAFEDVSAVASLSRA